MNLSTQILSEINIHNKYAKYLTHLQRRETWDDICDRYEEMLNTKYPALKQDINYAVQFVRDKKVLGSMRALQFAGKAIELNESRLYNCAYLPVDHYKAFSETMFLLLGGSGVGFSVQKHHVEKLPAITKPTKSRRYLVADSIAGWADAVKMLMKAYFGYTNSRPIFDFRDIRPKGAQLITAGGKAPGPDPLKECLFQIQMLLDRKQNGEQLTTIECCDIECYIADAVLAGGIRRAALIALFSFDDDDMITSKYGNWWETNPQRARANNSVVIARHRIKKPDFLNLWKKIEASRAGEPGILFTNDKEYGTNPCGEISLKAHQFCNLCEVNVSDNLTQSELNERVKVAAFLGTLQAGFTDFYYLRECWKRTTEKEALIGVSMTGICSGEVMSLNLEEASAIVKAENERVAKLIGINAAARTTTVKPSGNSSVVLGCSSGIHAWHSPYYKRRMRISKHEALYTYLQIYHPELIEDDILTPKTTAIVTVPIKAPDNAIFRDEPVINMLERIKKFNLEWIRPGHRSGSNYNNVSATVSVKDDEWSVVGEWMWQNRKHYNAISVLPFSDHTYQQTPYEDITEEEYNTLVQQISSIDLTKVVELDDFTAQNQEVACAGGQCEVI